MLFALMLLISMFVTSFERNVMHFCICAKRQVTQHTVTEHAATAVDRQGQAKVQLALYRRV